MNRELTYPVTNHNPSNPSPQAEVERTTAHALTLVTPRCREQVLPQTQAHEHHAALLRNSHSTTCLGTQTEKNHVEQRTVSERDSAQMCKNPKGRFQGRIGLCQVPRGVMTGAQFR